MTVPNVITRLVDQLGYIYKNGSILVDYNSGEIYYSYVSKGDMHTHRVTINPANFIVQSNNFSGVQSPLQSQSNNFTEDEYVVNFIRNSIAYNLKLNDTNIITLLTELCDSGYNAVFEHNSYVNIISIDIDETSSLSITYNTNNSIDRYECTVTHNGFTSDILYLNSSFDVLCWVEEISCLMLDADEDNIELINLFQMLYKKYSYRAKVGYDEYDMPVVILTDFGDKFAMYSKLDFNDNKIQCVIYDSNGPIDIENLNLLAANSKEAMNWTIAKFSLLSK